jgi:hypothetical protein
MFQTALTRRSLYKKATTLFLFIFLLVCFLFQVKDQVVKFYLGRVAQTVEKISNASLKFPHISFCSSEPFKLKELDRIGVPKSIFTYESHDHSPGESFPELNETWQNATYSKDEFKITWRFFDGECNMNATIFVSYCNSTFSLKHRRNSHTERGEHPLSWQMLCLEHSRQW